MTDSALGHLVTPPGQPSPSGDAWVTSLWQEMFTSETTTLLDGTVTASPLEQPMLWQFVRQLALETGTEAPTAVRVVGNPHVVTHEEPYTLDLGVPLLLALDQGDLGEIVSRVMAEREQNRADAEEPEHRSRLGRLGAKLRSTPTPRRSRPSGTARLEKAIEVATQWWIDEFVHPDLTDNLVPRPVYLGLAELLAERGGEIADVAGLEPRTGLTEQPNADEPALFLLMDPDSLFESVARAGLPPGTGELDWEDAMARWANRRSRASSIILFRCAQPKVTSLWSLLDVVEQGALPLRVGHALRLRGAASTDDCVFLLTGVLADALADVGAGMLTCSWGGVIDLVSETEGALDLSGVARQVVRDPAVVPYLRDILREYAVSPDWYPSDEGTGEDRALTAFLADSGTRQAPGTGFLTGMTPS